MSEQRAESPPEHLRRAARLLGLPQRLGDHQVQHAARAAARPHDPLGLADLESFGKAFTEFGKQAAREPRNLARTNLRMWKDAQMLGMSSLWRMFGVRTEPTEVADRGDRRFRDPAWTDNALFDLLKQQYLLAGRWLLESVTAVEDLDPLTAQKVEFFTRQVIDALSPSNFPATNPAVVRRSVHMRGENLVEGLHKLLDDLERNNGRFSVQMTPANAFEVGKDIANTPGKVVFRNDLIELIQYAPLTKTVAERPVLFIPPWMNKFYVLDLGEENSMLRWMTEQGHTVFVISWVNPGKDMADCGFEDYMLRGPLAAIDAIEKATGQSQVNVVGYCLGGILLAAMLAYLEAKGDGRVASATLMTTMVDFREAGEVTLFMDEHGVARLEERIEQQGFLDGQTVAATFSALRANDLVWSFYVNNYLMARDPMPFDLLAWNEDSTNMPAAMHTFFMRNMYMDNLLREPGGITLDGVPIDVRQVKTPTYVLSAMEDHIAPWRTTYHTAHLFGGEVEFVLAKSGHIAGVVNPPVKQKYGYWTAKEQPGDPDAWLAHAEQTDGSWWPHWVEWLQAHAGKQVPARKPGGGKLKALCDAPGTYVHMRLPADQI